MTIKPSLLGGRDDTGAPVEVGALYSVYQTRDIAGGGLLLFYAGKGIWINAASGKEQAIPYGEFAYGFYEFAARQQGFRADLAEAANPKREYTAAQRRYEEHMYDQQCDLNSRYSAHEDDALTGL